MMKAGDRRLKQGSIRTQRQREKLGQVPITGAKGHNVAGLGEKLEQTHQHGRAVKSDRRKTSSTLIWTPLP